MGKIYQYVHKSGKNKVSLLFVVILIIFISTTNVASANFFTNQAASVWDAIISFFAPDPVVTPPPVILPPPKVTLPTTLITPPPTPTPPLVNLSTLTTTKYVNTGLSTAQVQSMIDKALLNYKPPVSITQVVSGGSSSGLHVVGGGGSSSNTTDWRKKNSDLYFNKGDVAVGTSTLSGNASLQVKAKADTLGSDQVSAGDFSSQYGDEQIDNGDFGGNANSWELGDGWSYAGDSVVYDPNFLGPEMLTNGDFTSNPDGAEQLTDGDFVTDPEAYWYEGTGWVWNSGTHAMDHAPGNTDVLTYPGTLTTGVYYKVSLDISGTAGDVTVCLDDGSCRTYAAGIGTVSWYGDWANFDGVMIRINPSSDFDGSVTNISVKPSTWALDSDNGGDPVVYGTNDVIFTDPGSDQFIFQNGLNIIGGNTYQVEFDVSGSNDGNIEINLCGTYGDALPDGHYSVTIGAGCNTDGFYIANWSGTFTGHITNVSLKHVGGGNLSQSGTLTTNIPYKVTLEVGGTEGSVEAILDDGSNSVINAGEGVMTFTGTWQNSQGHKIRIIPSSDFNGNIDNVSVKPVLWESDDDGWTISGGTATHTAGDPSVIYDVSVNEDGNYYEIGDVLTLDGGNQDAKITVTETDNNPDPGPITGWDFTHNGTAYEDACYGVIGGHGSGAEFCANSFDNPTHTGNLLQPGYLDDNTRYAVAFHITGHHGTVNVCLDDGDCHEFDAGAGDVTFSGTYQQDSNYFLYFTPSYDFDGAISDVSVKPATINTAQEWFSGDGSELLNITSYGNNQGQINFNIADGGTYVGLRAPTWSNGNVVFTLPGEDNSAGSCLKTNGSGVLYFDTCGGGSSFDQDLNTFNNPEFNTLYSNVFYDNGNSNYYLDPGNSGTSLAVAGNVGIGTTSPSYKLDVRGGSAMFSGTVGENDATQGVQIGYGDSPRVWFGNGNASQNWQIDNYGGAFRWFTPGNVAMKLDVGPNHLGVNGGASIGSGYYGTASPSNGLIVQGNVGIGTTSPATKLDVNGSIKSGGSYMGDNSQTVDVDLNLDGASAYFRGQNGGGSSQRQTHGGDVYIYGGAGYNFGFNIDNYANVILANDGTTSRGNVGIQCASPDHLLELGGTGSGCNTGVGSYIDAGSTSFTANSSSEWKTNIQDYNVDNILDKINGTPVRTYDWKPEFCTGDNCNDKLGFIAQEFYTVLQRGDGLHVNGQDISMAEWLGIQALYHKFLDLKTDLVAWFGDATNGIADFFANRVHTETLCVGTSGDETCITKDKLDALLQNASIDNTPPVAPPVTPPEDAPPPTDGTPPPSGDTPPPTDTPPPDPTVVPDVPPPADVPPPVDAPPTN